MDYVITNPNKKVFIRLGRNGMPETCAKQRAQRFENSKARNVLDNLPKSLKRFHFKLEPVPEVIPKVDEGVIKVLSEKIIQGNNYELSDNISRWIDKFGTCSDVFDEAKQRIKALVVELDNVDKELLDILHKIELETPKDLYSGWKLYKGVRENRRKRRIIKNEILIIENVLEKINPSCLRREQTKKAIDGLFARKYTFRIVEEDKNDVL